MSLSLRTLSLRSQWELRSRAVTRRAAPSLDWRHALRTLLAFVILPNLLIKLPLLLLGEKPPLNLDYAALGVFASLLGGRLTNLAYAILLLIDGVVRFAPVFHFSVVSAASGVAQLFAARPLLVGLLGTTIVVLLWGTGHVATRLARLNESSARRSRLMLLVTASLIGAIDASNGTGEIFRSERARYNWNIAGSATWGAFCALREQLRQNGALEGDHRLRIAAASNQLFQSAREKVGVGYPRVAVVLVESWGRFNAEEPNDAILAPLLSSRALGDRYDVHIGTTPFHGPTTAAEFRELCEWKGTYTTAPKTPPGRCLPELLRQQGYQTISIHGFRRQFFDRNRWYPVIGFDSSYFDDDIRHITGDRTCGSLFAGPCDDDVIKVVRRELLDGGTDQRKLIYWLTLSSHFPIDKRAALGSNFNCGADRDAARYDVICVLMRVWHHNMENIRDLALDPSLPPTRWLIVGDHRPPLLDARETALFSPYFVPYAELIPRVSKTAPLEYSATPCAPGNRAEARRAKWESLPTVCVVRPRTRPL